MASLICLTTTSIWSSKNHTASITVLIAFTTVLISPSPIAPDMPENIMLKSLMLSSILSFIFSNIATTNPYNVSRTRMNGEKLTFAESSPSCVNIPLIYSTIPLNTVRTFSAILASISIMRSKAAELKNSVIFSTPPDISPVTALIIGMIRFPTLSISASIECCICAKADCPALAAPP